MAKVFTGKVAIPGDKLKVALRKFFTFLSQEKGITNEKVLKGLQ